MKIKKLFQGAVNFTIAAATTICIQYPAKADYQPYKTVYLQGFSKALRSAGFEYGGYGKFPYCFNTIERLDGTVPIVIVCPMETGKRNSNYAVRSNDTVSAIWMSVLVDETASRELNKRAMNKADLVAQVFARVRYNVTASSLDDVLEDEVMRVVEGDGASYVNSSGISCRRRVRNLTNIGTYETSVCFNRQGLSQLTIWF